MRIGERTNESEDDGKDKVGKGRTGGRGKGWWRQMKVSGRKVKKKRVYEVCKVNILRRN